jgi:hypothetical protein
LHKRPSSQLYLVLGQSTAQFQGARARRPWATIAVRRPADLARRRRAWRAGSGREELMRRHRTRDRRGRGGTAPADHGRTLLAMAMAMPEPDVFLLHVSPITVGHGASSYHDGGCPSGIRTTSALPGHGAATDSDTGAREVRAYLDERRCQNGARQGWT